MSEHLDSTSRETVVNAVMATCEYACEWADDATLFALLTTLAQHATNVAQHMHYAGQPLPDACMANTVPPPSSLAGTASLSFGNGLG